MNRLKELRRDKGDTQEALANLLGVSEKTISRWEKDEKSKIKSDKAQQLAEYFGVSVGYLLGYSEEINRYESIKEVIEKSPLVSFVEFLLANGYYLSDSQIKQSLDFLETTTHLNKELTSDLPFQKVEQNFLVMHNYATEKSILSETDSDAYIYQQYNLITSILEHNHKHPITNEMLKNNGLLKNVHPKEEKTPLE